ncbi:hypothetical protein CJU90_2806 [Yarrowia sp. C11]|nr:hypothetical protein CKK34_4253 [Yarrowia sp. E02]KAG5369355.1 hypothetical protein CJU90_2806 [Yarrowia sp. C11]
MDSLLELLPPEVYACILDHLAPRDLLRLRNTSRALLLLSEDYASTSSRASRSSIEPSHAPCCTLARLEKFREWTFLRTQRAPVNSEHLLHAKKDSVAYLALIIPGLFIPFVVRRESRRQLDRTDLQTLRIAYIQFRDVWKATGQRYIEYQEGGLSVLKGSTVDGAFKTVKIPPQPVQKELETNLNLPDYYVAKSVALRFNSELNNLGRVILLHSKTEHNTDENMLSHVFWHEYVSDKLLFMLTIVHVPEQGSFIREAYFWNNKVFLFCENYFLEADIVGTKRTRLVVENQAGTYHTDIAASQDHAVSPADTRVRYISEGKVLLGDYRVLDLDRQTVSRRESWVSRDKAGFYSDMSVRYGNGRFSVS